MKKRILSIMIISTLIISTLGINTIEGQEENQEKIFEIFHREKRLEEEGTGVGLAIVSQIIENSGGKIWVESEKGKGSKFYIKIPK